MGSISSSNESRLLLTRDLLHQLSWWVLFLVCVVFGGFALMMGINEILVRWEIADSANQRTVPLVFIIHAILGSIALVCGPLQFNRYLLRTRRSLHRMLGRIYVGAIWITSMSGLWLTIFFDVSVAAKVVFGVLAILWFATTTMAFVRIRQRKVAQHREWMIRSFALSFFFVTFTFWVEGLASTSLPAAVVYPLGVFLSWGVNLLLAEIWIRQTREEFISPYSDGG